MPLKSTPFGGFSLRLARAAVEISVTPQATTSCVTRALPLPKGFRTLDMRTLLKRLRLAPADGSVVQFQPRHSPHTRTKEGTHEHSKNSPSGGRPPVGPIVSAATSPPVR